MGMMVNLKCMGYVTIDHAEITLVIGIAYNGFKTKGFDELHLLK